MRIGAALSRFRHVWLVALLVPLSLSGCLFLKASGYDDGRERTSELYKELGASLSAKETQVNKALVGAIKERDELLASGASAADINVKRLEFEIRKYSVMLEALDAAIKDLNWLGTKKALSDSGAAYTMNPEQLSSALSTNLFLMWLASRLSSNNMLDDSKCVRFFISQYGSRLGVDTGPRFVSEIPYGTSPLPNPASPHACKQACDAVVREMLTDENTSVYVSTSMLVKLPVIDTSECANLLCAFINKKIRDVELAPTDEARCINAERAAVLIKLIENAQNNRSLPA
jgi:hypothetical protein